MLNALSTFVLYHLRFILSSLARGGTGYTLDRYDCHFSFEDQSYFKYDSSFWDYVVIYAASFVYFD